MSDPAIAPSASIDTKNPNIDAALNGVINLANVSKAYPVKLEKPLNGILKANVKMACDMKSVENSQYQNIKMPIVLCATLIASIPTAFLYIIGQRLFVAGLKAGS